VNPTEFAAAVDAGLTELRGYAEARMTSRCTIRRKTAATTTDPETGFQVPVWDTTHTALPLRLVSESSGTTQSRRVETAGVQFELAVRTAHLPASTSNLRDGDLLEVTSGENAGMVLRIVEADWADQSTARRVPVVATSRPEEWT
jgi:hypothetical protein